MSFRTFIEPKEKVLVNVGITFVQTLIGAWALTGYQWDKGVIAGAIGVALSTAWNLALKPYLVQQGWLGQ